jgi:mRNA-degrading endonuclease RelE of RelBE toxin-antitoxin system
LLKISPSAKQSFSNLPGSQKRGVFRQLRELLIADDPYSAPFVEMLQAKKFERAYKFRVGDYRVLFVLDATEITHLKHTYRGTLFLLDIRDRKQAY